MPPTPTAAESEEQIEPLLSVRDLSVVFELDEGTVRAVDGVSFEVRPGQVVGIVGESGCGKSVTMKAILQLIETPGRISRGEILYRQNGTGSRAMLIADEPTTAIDVTTQARVLALCRPSRPRARTPTFGPALCWARCGWWR